MRSVSAALPLCQSIWLLFIPLTYILFPPYLKNFLTDTAAVLLETALEEAKVDPYPLINAVYWLESACTFEQEGPLVLPRNLRPSDEPPPPQLGMLKNCPGALMKNAGLGHVHLVQNPLLSNPEWHTKFPDLLREALPMPISDVFHTIETGSVKWPQR